MSKFHHNKGLTIYQDDTGFDGIDTAANIKITALAVHKRGELDMKIEIGASYNNEKWGREEAVLILLRDLIETISHDLGVDLDSYLMVIEDED
jgi:hypothetical protein